LHKNLAKSLQFENKIIILQSEKRRIFMEDKTLDLETRNKVAFVTFIIEKFASAYKKNRQESYHYLKQYGGLDYVFKNWWALHIDNPFYVVREMFDVCQRNGGYMR
jgi:hypothetical protein